MIVEVKGQEDFNQSWKLSPDEFHRYMSFVEGCFTLHKLR
jgi:hypothetical protein